MQKIDIPFIAPCHNSSTLVVSIEGCNGAGKTTLLKKYQERHKDTECRLCVPDSFQSAKDTKHFMLFESSALCSAMYYLGGAIEVFSKHDKAYSKILFDRSIWSTFAAAYAKDEANVPVLFNCLEAIKQHVFLPNLVIVLDASFETCQERISNKNEGGEFDKDKREAFNKKRNFYRLLKESGYPVTFIDVNNISAEEVYCEFVKTIASNCNKFTGNI